MNTRRAVTLVAWREIHERLHSRVFLASTLLMLALVGARDFRNADRLERQLFRHHRLPTRYGETTRLVGLPAARAVIAFGRGQYARASKLLSSIPSFARSIGGSQAQRDLLYLTYLDAVRRLRQPVRSAAA